MTTSQVAKVFLLAVLFATGCERQKPLPAGAVQFEGTGIALVPGAGWQQLRTGPLTAIPDVRLPILEGQGELKGYICVVSPKLMNGVAPAKVAAALRKEVTAGPKTVAGSFNEELFRADSGLSGVHVSYENAFQKGGVTICTRTHFYFVRNKKGNPIGVNYTVAREEDSKAIREMIKKTLVSL